MPVHNRNQTANTGGKWLFHGTKRHKDNKLQRLELPCSRECKYDIIESEGNVFNPIFKANVQGRKHTGNCAFAEPVLLSTESLKCR